jgi:hypothetical protein
MLGLLQALRGPRIMELIKMQELYSLKMSESVNSATQHNNKALKFVVVCLSVLFTVNSSDVSQPIMNDTTVEEMLNHIN